jgi:DNA-binding HxlR family transcriptional regulator
VRGTFGPSGGFERSVPRATTRRRSAGGSPGPGLVPQTIELIGNRWSAAALAAAFLGARRFTDMLVMTGAPPTIVSDRLRTFCQMGVLETVAARAGSGRAEYRLTDKGRAFFPHVMVMLDWGDRWFRAPEGPATLLTHTTCGGEFHPVLHCSACARELHGSQIQVGGDPPKSRS